MPFFEDSDYSQPLQEGIDYSDNLAGKVEEVEPERRTNSFPTLGDLVKSDRFQEMNEFRKAYTLAVYKNKLAKHIVDSGLAKDKEDFKQKIKKVDEAIRPHIPDSNLTTGFKSFFGFNPGEEMVAEGAGMMATQRASVKGAGINNDLRRIALAEAHKSDTTGLMPTFKNTVDYVKKTDEIYKEWEELRAGAEEVLAEDVERHGRDIISENAGGINLTMLGTAANRMSADLLAATASSMMAGPVGPLAYYTAAGAARSDRAQRLGNPDRDTSDRASRSLGVGTLSGSLEFIGFGFLTNAVRAKRLAELARINLPAGLQRTGGAAIAEASTEFSQSILETFGHNVEALDDFITIASDSETWENAIKQAGVGAILGAGTRGGIEINNAAIPKIVQTEAYRKARKEIHKNLEKVDLTKRIREPIADLSNSIIETSKLINEKGKELQNLEESREAGKVVGEVIAEEATQRDLPPAEETTFTAEEVDGRYSKTDILSAFEAREQGEDPSVQDSNLSAKDFLPGIEGQNTAEIIRDSIIENGGIDIANSTHFKDSLQDVDGNPVFSPKFKAKRGRKGLTLDQHIEVLAENGVIPRDINPDVIINALNGSKNDFKDQRNSQPSLEDLEILAEASPNTEFEAELEEALFFPDPDAKPGKVKQSKESAPQDSPEQFVPPKEAMPVPFNIDNDPKVKRDTTRKARDIAKIVERDLGIPVRKGKFRQKALGIFKTNSKVIRTKMAEDLQVIAHETGHALSDRFNLATDQDSSFDSELIPLGEKTSGKDYTVNQKREEGRAEFFREFMVDPEGAKLKAPKFHKAFTEAIASDPKTQAGVDKLSDAFADIVSQSALERVKSKIVNEEEVQPKSNFDDFETKSRVDLTDKLFPLRKLTKSIYGDKDISILDDPYRLARHGAGAAGLANEFIENGIHDSSGNKITGGFLDVFKGLSDEQIKDFDAYLKARRISIDLYNRGITSGVQVDEANQAIAQAERANPEFKKRAKELKKFTDGLIEYSVREDILTREEADRILEKNTAYIPFARAYEKHGAKTTGTIANPFQLIKGDSASTLSGIATLENNVLMTVRAAANMKVYKALAKAAQQPGSGKFIEKVDGLGKDESIISFVNNGKREFYSVSDPHVYDVLTYSPDSAAAGGVWGFVEKALNSAARFVNATAIITPNFIGKNVARDSVASGIQSKNKSIPILNTLSGMIQILQKNDYYKKFKLSGADQSTFTKMLSGDKPQVNRNKHVLDLLISPFRVMEKIAQITEEAPRVTEFRQTYDRLKAEGKSDAEAMMEAGWDARNVTIDFQKSGRRVQKYNRVIPFLNANIQGKIKTLQTMKTPQGLARMGIYVMAPELILWALLKDDDDYNEQPEYVKDSYWLIPGRGGKGGEKFWKVPKPQGYSWFSNKFRNSLNSISGEDRDSLDDLGDKLWGELKGEAVSTIPALIKPMIEVSANYSFFRDRELIDDFTLDSPFKKDHFNAYTSEFAKIVGPKMNISPIYLDHLIYGYFTNYGKGFTGIVDSTFLKKMDEVPLPEKDFSRTTKAQLTGVASFLATNPNYGAVSIQEIFESNAIINSLKKNIKEVSTEEERRELISDNEELWKNRHKIKGAYSKIKSLGKKVQAIYQHKTMSPERKKKELRQLFDQMLLVSQKALGRK